MDAVVLGVAVRDIQIQFGRNDADSFRLAIAEVGELAFDKPSAAKSAETGAPWPPPMRRRQLPFAESAARVTKTNRLAESWLFL